MKNNSITALLFHGGWEGHHPNAFARLLADALLPLGIETDLEDNLECLEDGERLARYDVIIPFWTMGEISQTATKNLLNAVSNGTGLAGIHGGMGDAFRGNLDFEWVVGGHFVGHPYVGPYKVVVTTKDHPITSGLPESFNYDSEQYYMLVDPAVEVLAEAKYDFQSNKVKMPVAWCRQWNAGKVFYSALGHAPEEYQKSAPALELATRGIQWAARNHSL